MKSFLALIFLIQSVTFGLETEAPREGHTTEQVIEHLGDPIGTIELREKTLLLYPRGEITLRNGIVASVDLLDPEEFEAEQAILREERAAWLLRQKRNLEKQKAQGEAIRTEKMQSPAFAALPAKERVDFWREFQIRYPQVEVDHQISAALESYQEEIAELRSQQRIAELEKRVAAAEKEAAEARLAAEKLRRESAKLQQRQNYGLRYYTDPAIPSHRYYYRPPTVTIYSRGDRTVQVLPNEHSGGYKTTHQAPQHPVRTLLNIID